MIPYSGYFSGGKMFVDMKILRVCGKILWLHVRLTFRGLLLNHKETENVTPSPPQKYPLYGILHTTTINESTEVQTLGGIHTQLYHQCFEQVWQHNFTSIIGLRRSTQRHRSSKVGTSIFEGRYIDHRSSKVDTSIFED